VIKDILQHFLEDANQSVSPLIISYHNISSVTVRSSNRHQVRAGCHLSRHIYWTSCPLRMERLAISKYQKGITALYRL